MSQSTQTIRIFISSPGDVAEERAKARQVISVLQRQYGDLVELVPVMWEDLAIPATASLQEGIDRLLEQRYRVDIAVFILWSRLGNPIGGAVLKGDGSPYRSGTEREFDMMLAAHERGGGTRPVILAYTRDDDESFSRNLDLRTHDEDKLEEMIRQRRLVKQFIKEKFLDEKGRSLRAYHIYREPVGFAQRLHAHLRGVLFEFLSEREPLAVWTEPPYRGLEVFDIRHAPVFFGRDEETCALLQRLRERKSEGRAFVCVVGASGSGKSSLARAGVAATLIQRSFDDGVAAWRAAVFTPSGAAGDLFEGLAKSLAEALPSLRNGSGGLERFARCLALFNDEAASILLEAATVEEERALGGSVRVLLVLDQMDELWTESWIAPEQREKFLKVIEWLAGDPRAAVLATLRSDFYSQAQSSETFLRLKGERGHFDLAPPGAASLQQLIVLPAQRAGLRFERDLESGRSLDQKILEDAARDPAALPLLQYALLELHGLREPKSGLLSFSAYAAMGGVEGALARRASQLFEAMPKDSQDALAEILALLVSIDGASDRQSAVRRGAPLEELCSTPAKAHLVAELVKARFLTTNAGTAMLSHEALLKNWDLVRKWIAENQALLRMRARIEKYHAIWEDSGRLKTALLPAGPVLKEGKILLGRGGGLLEPACRDFVLASLARHRSSLWRGMAAAALVLAAVGIGLFFWWDHARSKTLYFSAISESFGVPVGVFRLDEGHASRRGSSYRLEVQRGRVRRASHINGSGFPAADSAAPFQAAVREIEYREDGTLQAVVFKNPSGRTLATHILSPLKPVDGSPGGFEATVEIRTSRRDSVLPLECGSAGLAAENPLPGSISDVGRRSEISAIRVVYSVSGLPVRKMFFNVYGTPRADSNGAFGVNLKHDSNGLLVSKISLDRDGAPSSERSGIQSIQFDRDARGGVVAVSNYGPNGVPVLCNAGWHREEIRRDRFGNPESSRFFDERKRPVFHSEGYAATTNLHDERGNLVKVRYFDLDGNPVASADGISNWTATYDGYGNRISMSYFDASGNRTLVPLGHAEWRAEYDQRGNLLRVADFGIDGKPVLTRDGIAGAARVVDEVGNILSTSFFGVNGMPVMHRDGYAKWTSRFDERGNEIEAAFFGVDGKPVLFKDGYASWIAEYDERGNKAVTRFFGVDGNPILINDGYATTRARFDEQGNEIERVFLGVRGEPVFDRHGIAGYSRVYDQFGNRISQEFFGVRREPVPHGEGYSKWTSKYDARGNEIEAEFFGVDGGPALHVDGYAKWTSIYNSRGNLLERNFFGIDGLPVNTRSGWSRVEIEYDELTGKEIRRTRYDKDGRTL